ncbi:hypothetical protein TRAPUB_3739 [Trametes pubescens]|uniref:F-box domain-containing protein n=1 Tax=Trametes pubescens TaxID=154538 RepID=A0A1M2VD19_TRAPU|nr:hypothetical protein TRAPUB_3739 [Trametes pubescens]
MSQPSVAYTKTTQRVLAIPEILELVFSFLNVQETAQCTCVCKSWSEVALSSLWRDVDDLHRLFKLLAPIEAGAPEAPENGIHDHHFQRPLEPADWARFMRYARRVRSLSVPLSNDNQLRGGLVFDEVAQTRTTLNILPRLSSLSWTCDKGERMRTSLMFMHDNVKQFTVKLVPSDNYSFGIYFQEIALRMPKLTHLDLRFTFPVHDIERDLCTLFEALPHLQKVILPKFTITAKIIEHLSNNPKLRVVQFEFMESQGAGDVSDVHNWFPTLQEDAFPSLNDLSVSVHLPHMVRFLNAEFSPAHLTCLYVHLLYIVPPYQVQEFLEAATQNCQELTRLYLDFAGDPSPLLFRTSLPDEDRISWNTLRPLLKLSKLVEFELHWDSPVAITQTDLEELASSLPALELLELNSEPLPTPQPPALTLRALIPFARHCPKMRELNLYVNASSADLEDASRELHASLPPIQFRSLTKLSFGLSHIASPEPVALFLSELCPLGCTVGAGVSWPQGINAMEAQTLEDAAVLVEMWAEASKWYTRWAEVDNMLPLLTRARMEERARRRELEHEVEDLRVRCRLLEERANVGVPADGGCILL